MLARALTPFLLFQSMSTPSDDIQPTSCASGTDGAVTVSAACPTAACSFSLAPTDGSSPAMVNSNGLFTALTAQSYDLVVSYSGYVYVCGRAMFLDSSYYARKNQRVRAVFANTSLISSLITADARMEKQWWFPSIRLLSLCRLHPMVQSLRFRRLFFLLLLRCVIMMQVLVASSLCYDGVRSAEVVSTLSSTAIGLIEIANRLADVVTSAAM